MTGFRIDRNKLIFLVIGSLFVFFHYGLGFMVSYQPDIYSTINAPDALAKGYVYPGGRLVLALLVWILRRPGQSYTTYYYISFVISLIVMITTTVIFSELIRQRLIKYLQKDLESWQAICIGLISALTITNLFSAEFALYPNSFLGFVLDILLCVISSNDFLRIIDGAFSYKDVLLILVCLVLAVFIYEPIIAIFVIISTLFSLLYAKGIREFVKLQIWCALFYGFAMTAKLVFTKCIINSSRAQFDAASFSETSKELVLSGSLPKTFIFDRITFGMWIFVVISLSLFALITFKAIKSGQLIHFVKITYLSVVTVVMGMLPFVFRLSNDYKPRIYYPLGLYCGLLLIYGILSNTIELDSIIGKFYTIVCIVVLCCSQWLSFVQMYVDQYITNYEDKYISEVIGGCIDEYEENTLQHVRFVTFYSDEIRTKYTRNNGWCITERAYDATWSKLPTLNYYLERDYKEGNVDPKLAEYFISRNWNVFSPEQIVIEGDTAHVCTY